jgi:hypothetical protein
MKEPWHFFANWGFSAVVILEGIRILVDPWNYHHHLSPPTKISPGLGIGLIVGGVLYASFLYILYLRMKKRS